MKKFQMINFDMPNNISSLKHAKNQSLALLMLGCPMGMAPELHPDVWLGGLKKFQMTHFDMPNNISSMKNALKISPWPC